MLIIFLIFYILLQVANLATKFVKKDEDTDKIAKEKVTKLTTNYFLFINTIKRRIKFT